MTEAEHTRQLPPRADLMSNVREAEIRARLRAIFVKFAEAVLDDLHGPVAGHWKDFERAVHEIAPEAGLAIEGLRE